MCEDVAVDVEIGIHHPVHAEACTRSAAHADAIERDRRIDGERVVYLGAVTAQERPSVLGGAAALLHPVHFDEPFGLSVAEAMACGTPVVAYGRGSMPEVIDEGVTGLIVSGLDEAVAAVPRAVRLDRRLVRARARERFDAERMVDDYLRVYRRVLAESPFVKSP